MEKGELIRIRRHVMRNCRNDKLIFVSNVKQRRDHANDIWKVYLSENGWFDICGQFIYLRKLCK